MTRTLIIFLVCVSPTVQLSAQSDVASFPPVVSTETVLTQNQQNSVQGLPPSAQFPPIISVSPNLTATQETTESPAAATPGTAQAPSTQAPSTQAPNTQAPSTQAPGTQAQNAPPENASTSSPQPPQRRIAPRPAATMFSMASIPNMIGDTTGGGCGALALDGQFVATIAHPTYACSRLNIAENNSPVLHDRVYVNYRHLHNASLMDIFSSEPLGGIRDFNIDRVTFGFEKRFGEFSSIEFRVPLNYQMDSNLFASQVGNSPAPPVATLPLDEHEYSVGNMGLIYKCCLVERKCFYLSSGLGVNLPTAPEVRINTVFDDDAVPIPGTNFDADVDFRLNSRVRNETVNVSPFVGAIYRPSRKWFSQGFFQFDIPLNGSRGEFSRTAVINGFTVPRLDAAGRFEQQPILRVNTGIGRWLRHGCKNRLVSSLAIMFEAHYSTTLADAKTSQVQLAPDIGTGATVLTFGNVANRIDVMNFSLGLPMTIGEYNFNPGFAVPITEGTNRGFDFELSLSLDRRF